MDLSLGYVVMTSEQLEVCADVARLYTGDLDGPGDEYTLRLEIAMNEDNETECQHVSALMVTLLYGRGIEQTARLANERWRTAFGK